MTVTVNAGGSFNAIVGQSHAFSKATVASPNPVGYLWSFGDGTFSPLLNPSHTYTKAGSYHVKLIAMDDTGLTGSNNVTATVADPVTPPPPPPSGVAVLEDFTLVRTNGDGPTLWKEYTGENPNQSGVMDTVNHCFVSTVTAVTTANGEYVYCSPRGAGNFGWSQTPHPYAQGYIKSGTFDPLSNRLSFWFWSSVDWPRNSNGGAMIEVGTYIRNHSWSDAAWQGAHYYHQFDPKIHAGKWHQVTLNRTPQHQVGGDPNHNWGDDPEWTNPTPGNQVHYFDGLTDWYWDFTYGGPVGTFKLAGPVQFSTVASEPDALVASIIAVHNGSAYEVTWAGIKNSTLAYDVAYSSQSLHVNGWASGTSGGTVASSGSAYTGCFWTSPVMAQLPMLYVGIRPQGGTAFTEVAFPLR